MTGIIETFRYGFFGSGSFSWDLLGYSILFAIIALAAGIIVFNRVEKNFVDTV
jgi:lipopolysaccharide transport system permease protein